MTVADRPAAHPLPPALILAGPTASGKSRLALALAEAYRGTIVNADALQLYRDLRILSARPAAADEARLPHRLYGVLDAAERGSAARWRGLAVAEIKAACAAGRLPIVVGGTGLYLRALMRGLAPVPDIPAALREEAKALHRSLGGARFRERLARLDPAGAARLAPGDTQRLIRAYEVARATGRPLTHWHEAMPVAPPCAFATILLLPPRALLYAACDARFAAMIAAGGLAEAEALAARRLDPGLPAMKAVGLPELLRHLRGETTLAAAIAAAQQATRRYAKRQMTWFRHQLTADLILGEQFSESLLHCSRQFIDEFLLTRRTRASRVRSPPRRDPPGAA
jgi:tRNA dimethylallyltransferase